MALSGGKLLRFANLSARPETIVSAGLEDPRQLAFDQDGNILVSDRGNSQQVKKFSADGKPLSAIGVAGPPAVGPYNPLHMNRPSGIAVDSQNRLWVAEADNAPRRVSLWSADGQLLRAFYGPTEYGGGGTLDPHDPSRFYYRGLEFKLDWDKGTDQLVRVFFRPGPKAAGNARRPFGPTRPCIRRSNPIASISPVVTRTIRRMATRWRSCGC